MTQLNESTPNKTGLSESTKKQVDAFLDKLRTEARQLQRLADCDNEVALARLAQQRAKLPAKRSTCLRVIANELGFLGWPHLVRFMDGEELDHFGSLLYPLRGASFTNIWFAAHEEARRVHAENGGYLLAFKRDFFIAEADFMESIGCDPNDPKWKDIGFDWAQPKSVDARTLLALELLNRRRE